MSEAPDKLNELKKLESYWLKKLADELSESNIPLDYLRGSTTTEVKEILQVNFTNKISSRLIKLSKNVDSLLFIILMTALKISLNKYTGNPDIIVGTTITKKNSEFKSLNKILAIRSEVNPELTFKELLMQVKTTVTESYKHQKYPFKKLISKLGLELTENRSPLFDVVLLLENINDRSNIDGLINDITILFNKDGEEITGLFEYNPDLFKKTTIEKFAEHYLTVLESVIDNPAIKISEVDLLSETEKHQLIHEFNKTSAVYPSNLLIHQLFEAQADKKPDDVAVIFSDDSLTYCELNEKANQLAWRLRDKGVNADQIVGIMIERSLEMIIGILAILKAGGAYLPIDPEYPKERIEYMIEDSKLNILLTQKCLRDKVNSTGEVIEIEDDSIYTGDKFNLENIVNSDNLAYIIYTSGSTGKPKGVMIEHRGLVNYITWAKKMYLQGEKCDFPLYSSLSFDLTVTSIYTPLTSGNKIIIYGNDDDELLISKVVREGRVQVIKLTPAHLQIIKDMELSDSKIKRLIVGGEELKTELAREIYLRFNKDIEIYNEYGPTETVVGCMIYRFDFEKDNRTSVPIGKPADNVQIYILDHNRKPVAVGIPGEIYISGDGVARGYLNKSELTAERFLPNPFLPEKCMYKTGDLAKMLSDGNIEFLGRIDHQVKIRGYRIELGEIENQLSKHPAIKEAVLLDQSGFDGDKYLCAYIVLNNELSVAELKEYLSARLPEYMVPSYFVILDQIPLTANGKVDRKVLAKVQPSKRKAKYVTPRNETEEELVQIWSEVLNEDKIGIYDNFFELGGHSLKATLIVAKIHQQFNVKIPLKEFFNLLTIKDLAEYILIAEKTEYMVIEPVEQREYYPVSSAQKRLFILNQLNNESMSYNVPFITKIEGQLDRERFENAIKALVKRHETLRTSFVLIDGEPMQKIHDDLDFTVLYQEVDETEIQDIIGRFIHPFDLNQAPLLRIGLIKFGEHHLFIMDMHHIISDGVSMEILFSEFVKLYEGEELPLLRIQYKDYAVWQNELLQSDKMKIEEEFWLETFAGDIPVLNLPTDYARPQIQNYEGNMLNFRISKELTVKLNQLAAEKGATLFMVLLASYNLLLSQYSGQEDIVIGTPIAGRPHADLEKIIGMFINTLALRNKPERNKTFTQFLTELQENSLKAFENQNYQFEMLVEQLQLQRNLNRSPLFDTMFILQNMEKSEETIHELKFIPYGYENDTTKFDLTMYVTEENDIIRFALNYSTNLFKKETIQMMAEWFIEILTGVVENPEMQISEINKPTEEEKECLLHTFNEDLSLESITKGSLQNMFYQMVDKYPDKIAIEYGSKTITYAELDQQTNILANLLVDRGFEKGSHLGILVDDRITFITLVIAAIKSGLVFVPFDSTYPPERLTVMMKDVDLDVLFIDLHKSEFVEQIFDNETVKPEIFMLDEVMNNADDSLCSERPMIHNHPDDRLYIYFTSGSTGKPKGIVGRYIGLLHFIRWEIEQFQINEEYRISQFTSPSFDAFLRDTFVPLCTGGTLCIPENSDIILDVKKLVEWIELSGINLIHCVPSVFKVLNMYPLGLENFSKLKYILMSGERIKPGELVNWYNIFDERIQLVNLYGPSETTMVKTVHFINKEEQHSRTIPIGKPIEGSRILIADENMNPSKQGVIGEIYIRTPYMSLGYYKDSGLTKEKFISNPFSNDSKDRLYYTGDLGRIMFDGNIEFIGRKDNQVKIHGVRVELGDIDNQLLRHEAIKEAVTAAREDKEGNTYFVAYFVADQDVSISDLRNYLVLHLPEYMIPSYLIKLEQMPLTPNGKIDRKALPEPTDAIETLIEYVAPRNQTEERLSTLWSSILGIEKIGIYDNFFEIGGHSLRATALLAKVNKEFNIEVPLREIFRKPTIKELAEYIQTSEKVAYPRIEQVEEREYYPASPAQKRLYVLHLLDKESLNYNMPNVMVIEGELDKEHLNDVLNQLVQRHESLRTSFEMLDGEVVQRIHQEPNFEMIDLNAKEEDLTTFVKDFTKPFDLSKAPLLRVGLVKFEENKHLFMLDMHHIISDGISQDILYSELTKLYQGHQLPDLRIQYKDFAVWQNQFLESEKMKQQEEYWLERFADEIPVLNLPYDNPRPSAMSDHGDIYGIWLEQDLTENLNKLARQNGATLFMALLAVYNILLSKYSGQKDISVGTPIAGRSQADLENIMGMFVNTLTLRNKPEKNKTVIDFLKEVKENALKAYENQDYQFEMLVDKLELQREMSRNPLFDVMFSLFISEKQISVKEDDFKFRPYSFKTNTAKFDLSLDGMVTDYGVSLTFNYSTDLFKEGTIARMANHLINITKEVVSNPAIIISEINMLSEDEKDQLLNDFNNTTLSFSKDQYFHQLFEEQVKKTPNELAVIFKDQQLTYQELNQKANQLAMVLRQRGIKANEIVGVMVERSVEMIIGVMGILKAGGAYLPIDPDYPEERIIYTLEDSNAQILLTQKQLANKIDFKGEKLYFTDEIYTGECTDLLTNNSTSDLAYVIYTSGTTGKPTGVMIQHDHYLNVAFGWRKEYGLGEMPVNLLQMASFSFDVFAGDLARTLLNGGKMVICPADIRIDYPLLYSLISEHQISLFEATPALVIPFMKYVYENQLPMDYLKLLILGSDTCRVEDFKKLIQHYGETMRIVNSYGATEATIDTSYYEETLENIPSTGNVPIGKPLPNMKMYVLGDNLELKPIGVYGELYIGGDSVARGYLNRPELTAERFIESPFVPGDRLYKTGDVVRWLQDGNIEFVGRSDFQVKIRGYRIELGEIENQLLTHPKIQEVVVLDKEDQYGNKFLCAYLVNEEELSVLEIKEYLMESLPIYMIPTHFINLDKMPLSQNGKINRNALPDISKTMDIGVDYIAPRNEIEEILNQIWSEILQIEKIGIYHNFFDLGGHSLTATRLMVMIHKQMNVELSLREIFERPTIAALAEAIKAKEESVYTSITPAAEQEYYPVSSAQKRMYILNQMSDPNINYNMPSVQLVEGKLEKERLESVFLSLIQRHELLRVSFEMRDGEIIQRIHENVDLKVNYLEAKEDEYQDIINDFIKPFDLAKAPLLRVSLVESENQQLLMVDMHHIISDAISTRIIVDDLSQLYSGQTLPELKIQYKDFAVWQNDLLQSEKMKKQEEYWLETFAGDIPVIDLPTDYPRLSTENQIGDVLGFSVEKELQDKLHRLANENGATLNMILLAIYNILLSKYAGQEDVVVGTPIAGRNYSELESIVGLFVNTLAMRNQPKGQKSFRKFLLDVKNNALRAYENQDYQFEMLVDQLDLERDLGRNPLFDVLFDLNIVETLVERSLETEEDVKKTEQKIKPYNFKTTMAKFDLSFDGLVTEYGIFFTINYITDLFNKETIIKMANHFVNIAKEVVENPEMLLSEIKMLSKEERDQLLHEFNNKTITYPTKKCFQQLFEEQVKQTPNALAVVFNEQQLSYRELNQKANQVASILREKGVQANEIVGIMVERSVEMIIGVMGILKAGGAYLPIDPDYPEERIDYMLIDSNTQILLTQEILTDKINFKGETIYLTGESFNGDCMSLPLINSSFDLAYVIYTSGSTGRPKGVMIQHNHFANVALGWRKEYRLDEIPINLLQMASFSFDVFAGDLARTLLNGGKMVICPADIRIDYPLLYSLINEHQISLFEATPALVIPFMEYVYETQLPMDYLQLLILGSDSCRVEDFRRLIQRYGETMRIINSYGATEATIDTSYYEETLDNIPSTGNVPIGKPLPNMKMYVLGDDLELKPIGVYGVLYIGGDSVGRGYLNRPELTAERFIDNPFVPGDRLYKTGDVVRWLQDGNIEFVGRSDFQVKIRGYRIELGEIENQLLTHPEIKDAVVVDLTDQSGTKYLCGYIVTDSEISLQKIRAYLVKNLPDYMIPSNFVRLEKLPLTPNGKIDRKGLPASDGSIATGIEYVAPRNDIEARLAEIFAEILRIEKVGVQDDFFEIGGHSLRAMQVVAKIHQKFEVEVPLRKVFTDPTINQLAAYIASAEKNDYIQIESVEEREYYPASSAQTRLYLMRQLVGDGIEYNMPVAWFIEGDFECSKLEKAINALVERHESLRTSFELIDGMLIQRIHNEIEIEIDYIEVSVEEIQTIRKEFVKPFDLSKAPLFRIKLVKFGDENLLLIDMHHIISDALSEDILLEEFATLYAGQELAELKIQYKDYAVWQNDFMKSKRYERQENYWLEKFAGQLPVLNMPTDYPRSSFTNTEGKVAGIYLEEELTAKLKELGSNHGATMYMVLLAAYNVLLAKYTGQEDIIIGTPVAGRPHADLERVIGVFINTLAMRNYPQGDKIFAEFLEEVKENSLKAYENQDYQFDMLVDKLKLEREPGRNPLFDISFSIVNLQNENSAQPILDNIKFRPASIDFIVARFDFKFIATERKNGMYLSVEYNSQLYKEGTVEKMMNNYYIILNTIVENSLIKLKNIEIEGLLKDLEKVKLNDVEFDF